MKIWFGGEQSDRHGVRLAKAFESFIPQFSSFIQTPESDTSSPLNEAGLSSFDVMHIFGSAHGLQEEIQYAAARGMVRLVHFKAQDIRIGRTASIRNPYARFIGHFPNEEETSAYLQELGANVHACIVPDMEGAAYVRPYFKRIYVLPYCLDLQLFHKQNAPENHIGDPLIVHAPRTSHIEGTSFVEEVLERMQHDGYRFRSVVRQGLTDEQRRDLYEQADIVIDQLLTGAFGEGAVEGMALGKPVLSYIRPEQAVHYPGSPIVSANPSTLYRKLADLLLSSTLRTELGAEGEAYALRIHHPRLIARNLAWIYIREARMLSGETPSEAGVVYNVYSQDFGDDSLSYSPRSMDAGASTLRLYPNRILKRKRGAFISFNLAEIPSGLPITSALMHLPVKKGSQTVSIHRITKAWDRDSIKRKKRLPRIAKKGIRKLAVKRKKQVLVRWQCTPWAKHWRKNQLNNHGVYIRHLSGGTPFLDVHVAARS